jgi:hypothetical protein
VLVRYQYCTVVTLGRIIIGGELELKIFFNRDYRLSAAPKHPETLIGTLTRWTRLLLNQRHGLLPHNNQTTAEDSVQRNMV